LKFLYCLLLERFMRDLEMEGIHADPLQIPLQ